MGAREETGCFSSPALAAAAHRLLRARSLRAGSGLQSLLPGFSPTAAGADRRRRDPATAAPERLALHFFPALRAPRDRLSTQSLPLKSRRVPPSLPCARSPAPARSPSSAGTAGPIKNGKLKKEWEPGESRLPRLGSPISSRAIKKSKRKTARLEKLLFPPFRKGAENKLPVADAPPEFRSGSDT